MLSIFYKGCDNIIAILIGFASGIISGMGIGGGTVLIPSLVIFLGIAQKTAQCANLVYFIPTAIAALIIHIKNKRIRFKTAVPVIITGLVGAFLGSRLALVVNEGLLRKGFAVFLLCMGLYEILGKNKTLIKN